MLTTNEGDRYIREWTVRCDDCGIEQSDEYEADARAAWSRRAAPAVPDRETVNRLTETLYAMRSRDDQNGSLPVWYREQIDAALKSLPSPADTKGTTE